MKQRLVINSMPLQGGLINTGGQATIPETSFWEMVGAATGADGRAYKRPGLKQWGQTIKEPITGGVSVIELFHDLNQIELTEDADVPVTVGNTVTFSSESVAAGADISILARPFQSNDGTWDDANRVDLRMFFKANGPLPDQSATTNQDYGFSVAVRTNTTTQYVFLFLSGAIYYYNGTSFVPSLANVDDQRWHMVQFSITGTTTAQIFVDEVLQDTVTLAGFSGYGLNNRRFYLAATSIETGEYEVEVDFVQVRSGNGAEAGGDQGIVGVPITAIYDWGSHVPDKRHLLVVAGDIIYEDPGHSGNFFALDATDGGRMTTFAPWLDELLIVNAGFPLRRWTGIGLPEDAPAATPDNVYLAASHQSRVCVVTEDAPLVVFVSGANDISDWTTEDSVSATGESFFLPIPDHAGNKIVGMMGDYNGQLVIWTESSVWTLIGSSIDTFVLRRVSQATGLLGARAWDIAGQDAVFTSARGVHSLGTVIQYGDVAAADLSKEIRNLWQHDNQFGLRKMIPDARSSVAHMPQLARTYLAVRQQGDSRPASIYEFNHDTGRWSGPWALECEAIDFVMLGFPSIPMLMVGDTVGRVARVSSDRRSDYDDTEYTYRIRSARLDGRSIDPSLVRRDKHWHELRLFVLPRGAEGLELTWTADGRRRSESLTVSQNKYNEGLVDTTFFLDTSHIVAAEKVAVVTQILDMQGAKWLEFEVASTAVDGDVVLLGFQVDFSPAQDSKENA